MIVLGNLTKLATAVTDGLCAVLKDEEGIRFVDANPSFLRMSGYSMKELRAMSPQYIFTAFESSSFGLFHTERLFKEGELILESFCTGKNGIAIATELSVKKIAGSRQEELWFMVIRDISEKHWIEQHGVDYEIAGGLTRSFLLTRITVKPPSDKTFLKSEWESRSILSIVGTPYVEQAQQTLNKALRTGKEQQLTVIMNIGKRNTTANLSIHPVINGSGEVTRFAFGARFSTERNKNQDPGAALRILMAEKQMTATRLAELTGLSIGTISKIRNSKTPVPHKFSALCIADALGVKVSDIWPL